MPYLRDPHPRVRYAACNAIGQMSTDFQDTLQKKFHPIVLTNLIPVMGAPEPRYLFIKWIILSLYKLLDFNPLSHNVLN